MPCHIAHPSTGSGRAGKGLEIETKSVRAEPPFDRLRTGFGKLKTGFDKLRLKLY